MKDQERKTIEMGNGNKNQEELSESLLQNFSKPDKLLKLVGSNKRYQKQVLVFLSIFSFLLPFISCILPFIFYQPTFFCYDEDHNTRKCTEQEACNNEFGYKPIFEIHSLVEAYQLYCENSYLDTIGKTSIFMFSAVIATSVVFSADYIGRLNAYYVLFGLLVLGNVMSLLSNSYILCVVGISFVYTIFFAFYSLTFIYSYEITG